jgi:hypothetical protein
MSTFRPCHIVLLFSKTIKIFMRWLYNAFVNVGYRVKIRLIHPLEIRYFNEQNLSPSRTNLL